MVLACSYKWSAVRAYHYKILRSIELGLVKWGDSFQSLKQPFFISSALLPKDTPGEAKQPTKPPATPIALSDICDAWSWHDDRNSTLCSKLHVCIVCKRSDHRARDYPKTQVPRSHWPPRLGFSRMTSTASISCQHLSRLTITTPSPHQTTSDSPADRHSRPTSIRFRPQFVHLKDSRPISPQHPGMALEAS